MEEKRLRSKLNPELVEYLEDEPRKAAEKAKIKWCELGPLKIYDIINKSTKPDINFELPFGKDVKNAGISGQVDTKGRVNGIGRLTINNGTIYEGQLKDGKMDGYGRFIASNGDVHIGLFKSHQKHGEGEMCKADGTVFFGVWSKGHRLQDGVMTEGSDAMDMSGFGTAEWKKVQTKLASHIGAQMRPGSA